MARVLGVSPSGYYAWRRRPPSARARADAELRARVQAIHGRSRGTYGAPRIHAELTEGGVAVSRKRVARVMRSVGVAGVSRRRGPRTTRRNAQARPAPDRVERRFEADAPNRLWVADITYVPTLAGFLYLAIVLDVFSRRVVGWAMAGHLRTALVVEALEMAVTQRRPEAVIHHSDSENAASTPRPGLRRWVLAAPGTGRRAIDEVRSATPLRQCDGRERPQVFATLECELLDRTTAVNARAVPSTGGVGEVQAEFRGPRGVVHRYTRRRALAYEPRSATGRHWSSNLDAPSGRRCGSVPGLWTPYGREQWIPQGPLEGPRGTPLRAAHGHPHAGPRERCRAGLLTLARVLRRVAPAHQR